MNVIIEQLEWLSLGEAADHLAGEHKQSVDPRHLFRLGLKRTLRLSMRLRRDAKCRVGMLITAAEKRAPSDQPEVASPIVMDIGGGRSLVFGNEIADLEEGVYDIPDFVQFDGSRSEEPHESIFTRDSEIGACLQRRGDARVFQMIWNFNGKPSSMSAYPRDCEVVIRPSDLDKFVQQSLRPAARTASDNDVAEPEFTKGKPSREALLLLIHAMKEQLLEREYANAQGGQGKQSALTQSILDRNEELGVRGLGKTYIGDAFAEANRAFAKVSSGEGNPK